MNFFDALKLLENNNVSEIRPKFPGVCWETYTLKKLLEEDLLWFYFVPWEVKI